MVKKLGTDVLTRTGVAARSVESSGGAGVEALDCEPESWPEPLPPSLRFLDVLALRGFEDGVGTAGAPEDEAAELARRTCTSSAVVQSAH